MKNSYYFPHDYHARHDPKLEKLRMEVGPVSDGIFWDLVEMLYEESGYLKISEIPLYAKMLNTDEHMLNKVVTNAFSNDGQRFWNDSLLDRLKHIEKVIEERQKAGKASGIARQRNICSTNAEHLRNNINKVNKVKDIKEDNIFEEFCSLYPKPVNISVAYLQFKTTIKDKKDFSDLKVALNNYKGSNEAKKGYVKNADTWLIEWKEWLNYKPQTNKRIVPV